MLKDKWNFIFEGVYKKMFFFFFFLCVHSMVAQDWVKDLKSMNQTYSKADSYSMSMAVSVFDKKDSKEPESSYTGKVAKDKDSYYSEMMGKITIYNSLLYVVIDETQKMIMYKTVPKVKKNQTKVPTVPMSIDSFMYANSTATYLANTASEKRIRIVSKSGQYSQIEVSIDPVKNVLTKMIFYTENKEPNELTSEKVVVNYSEIKINNAIPESTFSEKKYFTKNGDKIKPTEKYKNYQIIDENKSINNN